MIFRIPTPTFGLGLVENVSDDDLQAALLDTGGVKRLFGISGEFNRSGNDGTITRFGWKAQNKSLLIFAGEAYNVEQGVTNELFPNERETDANCQYNATPEDHTPMDVSVVKNGDNPLNYSSDVVSFALFMRLSAAPTPARSTASTTRGQQVFNNIGCQGCHVTTQTTATSVMTGQSNVTFSPFSDFALHDMGNGLADGITQGNANGREFRTAPLWGVGQRIFFLHDGRTQDLYQAITAHASNGSEANTVISHFQMLPTDRPARSIEFLAVIVSICVAMYRWWVLAVLACLAGALAAPNGGAVVPPANPEDGKVAEGRYTNEYFKITYPLPADWSKDWEGPPPSYSGYYVLTALKGGERAGTMLIAAQDQFFAVEPLSRSAEMVDRLRRNIAEIDGMTVDREPQEMMISGRQFTRLDFSGVGLYRMVLITESRCHFVSFNLTTADPRQRASLAQSLDALSPAEPGDQANSLPVCVKDYATPEHLVSRIEPTSASPKFTSVPVRIIIGANGRVRHIHVIRGSAEQKQNIAAALTEWQFRPFTVAGRPVEIETGLTFRF